MKNKKTIMSFSALLIIIFHLWINIFSNNTTMYEIEDFIRKISFVGVDIFFFITSYTISKNNILDYKKFIFNRFINIYVIFVIFSIMSYFLNNWSIKKLILTISGIDLFISGGGSFLWFIPAIMIVYLLLPIINKYIQRHQYIILIIWAFITLLINSLTSYNSIFIFTNRIPIIFIGSYVAKKVKLENITIKKHLYLMVILLIVGIILLYNLYTKNFKYIYDFIYIISIPSVIGLIMLLDLIPTNKVFDIIGSSTLEMYCIQMLFGYKIANSILNVIINPIITNIIVIMIIISMSIILHKVKLSIYQMNIIKIKNVS